MLYLVLLPFIIVAETVRHTCKLVNMITGKHQCPANTASNSEFPKPE